MSRTLLVVLLLGTCLALATGERARFDNYRVYKVTPDTKDALRILNELDGSSDSLIFLDGVHSIKSNINVVVAPHKVPDFLQTLSQNGVNYELIETNAQTKLDENEPKISSRTGEYDWKSYHELDDTYSWLESLAGKYPEQVTVVKAGTTYEKRDILGIKISKKSGNKGIFIEGGIHAREWISPATVTYIASQLLTSKNPAIQDIAENYDWYLFPHANPDGYVYTHKTNRMWRKTRSPQGSCYGVDANRNWDFHWNEVGASSSQCSDTFAGSKAFSEIETKTFAEYIESLRGKLHLYISFHSYSQLLLFPYGHTSELPSNYNDLKSIMDVTISALNRRYSTTYTGGNIYNAIYPASGASVDYVYGKVDVKLSYCYELRPSSNSVWYGFQLPADQIIPTGEETLDSIVAMISKAKDLKYLN